MAVTIKTTRLPADATQQELLRTFFASSGFLAFREMVASHCIEHQTKAIQALMYSESEELAKQELKSNTEEAVFLNRVLDLLDDLQKNESEWITVKL